MMVGPFAVVVNVKTVAFVLPPLNELKKRLYLSSKKTVSGKILRGLIRSAEKRPVAMEQMEQIVDHVEARVRALGENEVSTNLIGEYVMEDLKDVDEISYIRFASVYRQFKDMSVFLKELQEIVEKANEPEDEAKK